MNIELPGCARSYRSWLKLSCNPTRPKGDGPSRNGGFPVGFRSLPDVDFRQKRLSGCANVRRFLIWLARKRCFHRYDAVGHVSVARWTPCFMTNCWTVPPTHAPGAYREIRVTMRCHKCGQTALIRGTEKSIAGAICQVEFEQESYTRMLAQ